MPHSFLETKKHLPNLGTGLGLRREIANKIFSQAGSHPQRIQWLEIIPENFLGIGGTAAEQLEQARNNFELVSHGVNLSIGGTDPLNDDYLTRLRQLLKVIDSPWWSDHLCFTALNGIYMHDLLPLPFSMEAAQHVIERIKAVQHVVGRPFLLENISYYMNMPGQEMTEAQFLTCVLEGADCGLLFDVNNVYVNSLNHAFDPKDFIDSLPLERVVQIHVAGHDPTGEVVIDTHGEPVIEPVYELLEYTLSRADVKAVLLERDQNLDDFESLMLELDRIASITSRYFSSTPTHTNASVKAAAATSPS